jgi:predicted DCC family thiol-disulfide oxidoreductase YuxK
MLPGSPPNDVAPVLLYDGVCGFCSRVVQFVLRVERRNTLRFAALQGRYGQEMVAQNRVLQGVDSMAWVEPGTPASRAAVFVRSEAVLRLLAYLGMPWSLGLIGRLLPVGMRDRAYDWVARRRLRLVRGAPACSLPSPGQRRRFLE